MTMQAKFRTHTLQFIIPGGTSRGVLQKKDSWFIQLWEDANPLVSGVGECSIIPKLSVDDVPELETKIAESVSNINQLMNNAFHADLQVYPALRFALETALLDLQTGGRKQLFLSEFTQGKASIPINGLLWMGNFDFMWHQAEKKFKEGFSVLKMKVGALDFDEEIYFISQLRKCFPGIELRLDANGGFPLDEALERLYALNQFHIHSIEQPIKAQNAGKMAELCKKSPIAIALDEELIGIYEKKSKEQLLKDIKPQYIILKPSLLGGFRASDEWIFLSEKMNIGWWATSALESNIGLNAIAQWAFTKNNPLPQGLGTGSLYENNIASPLVVENGCLHFKPNKPWADLVECM